MSYCRFSSDNWRCDVYVYEDVAGGFTTHVAGNRVLGDVPPLPDWPALGSDEATVKDWAANMAAAHQAQHRFLDTAEHEPIALPYAGETLHDDSLEALQGRLTMLQRIGYNVPAFVFDALAAELKEGRQ